LATNNVRIQEKAGTKYKLLMRQLCKRGCWQTHTHTYMYIQRIRLTSSKTRRSRSEKVTSDVDLAR
jgi:hypothetical protein